MQIIEKYFPNLTSRQHDQFAALQGLYNDWNAKIKYDFIVSRAVMPLGDLLKLIRKNVGNHQHNAMPNGLICLKGGEIQGEIAPVKRTAMIFDLKDFFDEEFFQTKKAVYVPI